MSSQTSVNPKPDLSRWLVFASRTDKRFLCICAARDADHALRIARQQGFQLKRDAAAFPETPLDVQAAFDGLL